VSVRQLDPVALLTLRATGSCQVSIPEWFYDRDCPGHYMRRIKSVGLSIPSVVGPYTSVNCTLTLLRSSIRKSSIAGDDYRRQGTEDDRFSDYAGSVQSVVTSSATNDSGLFELNLRDERFLPFEGAGAVSTWKLDLPAAYRAFDYSTIADVILHIRYTARQGVEPGKVTAALDALFEEVGQSSLALAFNLRQEFPTEWSAFVNGADPFAARLRREASRTRKTSPSRHWSSMTPQKAYLPRTTIDSAAALTGDIEADGHADLSVPPNAVLKRDATTTPFLVVPYFVGVSDSFTSRPAPCRPLRPPARPPPDASFGRRARRSTARRRA
jgi:hypothetical protein